MLLTTFLSTIGAIALLLALYRVMQFLIQHLHGCNTSWEQYRGRWAVVTGASVGTGLSFCESLAQRGVNIVLISRRKAKLEENALILSSKYKVETKVIAADLSNINSYELIKNELRGTQVDVLVNNVGGGEVDELPFMEWVRSDQKLGAICMSTNITPTVEMTRIILPGMIERRRGRIINVSSFVSEYGVYVSNYACSKAYINKFSDILSEEVAHYGVQVRAIILGEVSTPSTLSPKPTLHVCSPFQISEGALNNFSNFGHVFFTPYWFHDLEGCMIRLLPHWIGMKIFHLTIKGVISNIKEKRKEHELKKVK
eukprot:TRINITY_DN2389_c0_g1_i1.p1 TRINITY_DN2389_c0_g1~~TRINITY_DN2389_c0_g1_i1.p1  ORF type:complete len:313 (+),score=73.87 TRINITY_DN2389_c0_g1_i1:61-999(+)